MVLVLDNNDSFTYNLVDYLLQLGAEVLCLRTDSLTLSQIIDIKPERILISPGPKSPEDYPLLFEVIDHFKEKIPILGVCLGHQAIGVYFGAALVRNRPEHGKVHQMHHYGHLMFDQIPELSDITRYHSLLLSNVQAPLKVTGTTEENQTMAIAHESLPIWGVQYHPEAILTTHGMQILANWLRMSN